jgi:hypothetical protein
MEFVLTVLLLLTIPGLLTYLLPERRDTVRTDS